LLQLRLNLHTGRGQGPDGAVETDPAQVLERAGMMAARVMAEAGWRVEATIVAAGAKAAERLKAAAEQA
jgi:hypothetical protein